MADVTIAAYNAGTTNATVNTRAAGAVFPSTGGFLGTGIAMTAGQTISIDVEYDDDILIFLEDTSAGANTFTIDAGAYPTSPKKDIGSAAIAMVISDVIMIVPAKGRHLQSNGKITATMSAGGRVWAFRAPPGFVGRMPSNP